MLSELKLPVEASNHEVAGVEALPVCLWRENSNRLVSLLEMLEQYAFSFYHVVCRLEAIREVARISESVGRHSVSSKIPDHTRRELLECLPKMRTECDALSLDSTSGLVGRLETEVPRKGDNYTYKDLLNDLDTLSFSFSSGLKKRVAFLIGDENKKFFQKDDLFGSKVNDAFPSCVSETRDAGNCYALEQNEASVFHSMRVLERGLGTLAKKFGVDFSHTNWHNVIEEVEKKVRKMDSTFGADWKEQQKFCSQAATHFMFLKDAWRNHFVHGRDPFDKGKAFSVFDHVRQFMQALAEGGLKE